MKTISILIVLLSFILFSVSVSALVNYINTPTPADNSEEINYSSNVTTCIVVDKLDGCTLDIYFYENSTGSWVEYQNYTTVAGGLSYCGNFSVLCGTTYYWKVASLIDCGQGTWWENHTYSFTTADCSVSHVTPSNNSINNCPCCLAICVKMSNLSGDTIKFAFQSNYTGSWTALEDDRVVPANETYCICVPEFVWFNYTYYWRVIYHDNNGVNYSDVYHFTTADNIADCPCGTGNNSDMVTYPDFGILGLIGILGLVGLIIIKNRR